MSIKCKPKSHKAITGNPARRSRTSLGSFQGYLAALRPLADREGFAAAVQARIDSHPNITVVRRGVERTAVDFADEAAISRHLDDVFQQFGAMRTGAAFAAKYNGKGKAKDSKGKGKSKGKWK